MPAAVAFIDRRGVERCMTVWHDSPRAFSEVTGAVVVRLDQHTWGVVGRCHRCSRQELVATFAEGLTVDDARPHRTQGCKRWAVRP